jgi:hypothetical protein
MRPRDFAASEPNGYYNAALGTAGVAIEMPVTAHGFDIQVDAACYIGVRTSDVLATFNADNYGVILFGGRYTMQQGEDHIHVAPVTGTAEVAIAFM